MSALIRSFAAECGYRGNSPAMLKAFEDIRQSGIAAAREAHFERRKVIEAFKDSPGLFFATIRPSLTTCEAIEDAKRFLVRYRNMPTWQREGYFKQANEARRRIVFARFFRRFGSRVWPVERAA